MKLTPWMLTVGAFLILALLSTGFLFKKLFAREEVAVAPPERRVLPMAVSPVEAGTRITAAHVGNGPWPGDAQLEPDTFTSVDSVIGRIAKQDIDAARPLRGADFYGPGELPKLDVADGHRAVAVDVADDSAMVDGLIKPDEYVDVHLTIDASTVARQPGDRRDGPFTLTLFDGVRVIAMNRSFTQAGAGNGTRVTLELTPEQSQAVLLGKQYGTLALTYNPEGPGDGGVNIPSDDGRLTLRDLLGIEPQEEKEKPFFTEQYRGGSSRRAAYRDGQQVFGDFGDDDNGGWGGGVPVHSGGDGWYGQTEDNNRQASSSPTAGSL